MKTMIGNPHIGYCHNDAFYYEGNLYGNGIVYTRWGRYSTEFNPCFAELALTVGPEVVKLLDVVYDHGQPVFMDDFGNLHRVPKAHLERLEYEDREPT